MKHFGAQQIQTAPIFEGFQNTTAQPLQFKAKSRTPSTVQKTLQFDFDARCDAPTAFFSFVSTQTPVRTAVLRNQSEFDSVTLSANFTSQMTATEEQLDFSSETAFSVVV